MSIARHKAAGWRRLEVAALILALLFIMGLAAGFTLFVVQLQGGAAAYMAGNSHWSRAQIGAVYALHRYQESGSAKDLETARDYLDIPLGDRQARLAMEAEELDREAAIEGLIRGRNAPEDIPRMIWVFRQFGWAPALRDPIETWAEADIQILKLTALADEMEAYWRDGQVDPATQASMLERLNRINADTAELSEQFVKELTDASRWLRETLTLASIVVMAILGLLGTALGWRLIHVVDASRQRFQGIFERAGVGMAELDRGGHFVSVNPSLCEILAYPKAALLGLHYETLLHPDDQEIGFERNRKFMSLDGDGVTLEHRLIRKDGDVLWVRVTASTVADKGHTPEGFIAVIEDVSESRRLSEELNYQANHDSLTGLFNRRALERSLAEVINSLRREKRHFSLCFIDLDEFKVVNDTCGHTAGDHMLRQVAETLQSKIREGDILARAGGDEFTLILRDCDLNAATRIAEKLRLNLEEMVFEWDKETFSVSCSMGLVPINTETPDIGSVMRSADIACYLAKEQGRNRIHVSSLDDEQVAQRQGEMQWLSRIRSGLSEDRFYLDAQVIAPLQGQDSLRYEVLARMLDEEGRRVPPGAFLGPAERFGSAHEIDRWVINHVCRTLADHKGHLAELDACHVNISGRSFDRKDFKDYVLDTMNFYGIRLEKLCFEVTETAAMSNVGDAVRFMKELGDHGCQFALDDFGAGLSSFGYLRRLPVEYLKIDGAFVRDIEDDQTDLAMVRAINEVGHTLNKKTIAEFVESSKAKRILANMGVHYGQGFAIHRPTRLEKFLGN